MIRKSWSSYKVWCGVLLLVAGSLIAQGVAKVEANARDDAALGEKAASYIHAKYGWPDSVKATASPFQASNVPGFLASTLTTDDGKQQRNGPIFLTIDRHYLIVGMIFAVVKDPKDELLQHVREQSKFTAETTLTAGPFRKSGIPNFLVTTVNAESPKGKGTEDFYVTSDNRVLVLGKIFNLGVDLRRQALKTILTTNQPSQGPLRAPVTIVEYADLECPMCGKLHLFLENDLLPKYGDKVRVVFKEFPLVQIHDWSLTAAIANECVYKLKPEAFAPYRTLIFQNQNVTNAATVRNDLLAYANQVGVDRSSLAGCLDSKASMPRIDEGTSEAKTLEVQSTPTCFINGRMLVGFASPDAYYKAVDEALQEGKKVNR